MKIHQHNNLYVDKSTIKNAGRGVFTAKKINAGDIVETCPVVVFDHKDYKKLKKTKLRNYYFIWGAKQNKVAITLGYGSLYNHSYSPNCTYKKHFKENIVQFIALKDIGPNKEITVNYNSGNPDDQTPIWIKSIPAPTSS